jgi:hypothetical protein
VEEHLSRFASSTVKPGGASSSLSLHKAHFRDLVSFLSSCRNAASRPLSAS